MCLTLLVSPGKGQIFSIIRNKNPGLKEETRVSYFSRAETGDNTRSAATGVRPAPR